MSKPADFMLGILDFFAVLLPGMIATAILREHLPNHMQTLLHPEVEHALVPAVVYLLTSFALGHFVFMGGSRLDTAYDGWRKRTKQLDNDAPYLAATDLR